MRIPIGACTLALTWLLVPTVDEVSGQTERPVHWTLEPAAGAVEALGMAGQDSVVLQLDARIDQGWYLYAPTQPASGPYPMEVDVAAGRGWRLVADLLAPPPHRLPDRNFNLISEVYRGSARFYLPLQPPDDGSRVSLEVLVRYQVCTRTYCLPPRTDTLRLPSAGETGGMEASEGAAAAPPTFLGTTRSGQPFATFPDDGLQATSNPCFGRP